MSYSNGYYGDASRGGAYQPINYIISQTAASDGTATFLFDAVALSNTWTMTINCAGAPDTAMFMAASGGTTYGQFKGSNSWGPLQLQGGDRLTITATGLIPGTLYQFAGYGYCNTVNEPEIVYPTAYADSVTTSTEQIYLGSSFVALVGNVSPSTIATIPISPTYRSIYILATSLTGPNALSTSTYTAIGNVTNFVYNGIVLPYASSPAQAAVRIPFINSKDTSLTLRIIAPTGSTIPNATFYYGGDLANVDAAVYPEGTFSTVVTNPSTNPVNVAVVAGTVGSSVTVVNTTSQPVPIQGVQGSGGNQIAITPGDASGTPLYVQIVGGSISYVPMGGDVSGNSNAATVVGIEGKLIATPPTAANQVLVYNGATWNSTTATGTGSPVFSTSPTLVSPALGTPTSVTLTNGTNLPIVAGTTGTLSVARGGTGTTTSTGTAGTSVVLSGQPSILSPTLTGAGSGVTGTTGQITLNNVANTAGTTVSAANSTYAQTANIPDQGFAGATDTFVLASTTQTLSNKTFITPVLGTPTSGTLTNCTGLPIGAGTTGTLAITRGGTGTTTATGTAGSVVLSSQPSIYNPTILGDGVSVGARLVLNDGPNDGYSTTIAAPTVPYTQTANLPSFGASTSDTFVFQALAQTLTNKTISAANNTISLTYVQGSLSAGTSVTTTTIALFSISLTAGTWLLNASYSLSATTAGSCVISVSPNSASATGAYFGFS